MQSCKIPDECKSAIMTAELENKIIPKRIYFPNYISQNEVEDGLRNKTLVKGILHINPKYTKEAYLENEYSCIISSFIGRNRALDGDEVILKTKEEVREDGRKEMEVVHITKEVHPRTAVGYLKPLEDNPNFSLFLPRDKRVPKIHIHKSQCKIDSDYKNILVVAKITKWVKINKACGKIIEVLGPQGDLKVENLAILKEFSIDCELYKNKNFLFDTLNTSDMDFFPRFDIRGRCVFTVDNPKSKDLDDALSCHELPNGNYEIGVHISDVSHFVKENTELDELSRKKGTSIYLIHESYHMLPDEIRSLCSLSPGTDKFTFTIFWEITPDGTFINRRILKTVINSCVQLNYQQAQMLIDDPKTIELLLIYNGYTLQDLSRSLRILDKISKILRECRIRNCGIRSNRNFVSFLLDETTGEPVDIVGDDRIPSRKLVEEFMLLSNITIAEKIYEDFRPLAFLRTHEAPHPGRSVPLQKNLECLGIHIKTSSSREIQKSLDKYTNGEAYKIALNHLINKSMQKEKYVCTGDLNGTSIAHFGLGFHIYTHFTSPIRRYADIVVHRLLAASLKYMPTPRWSPAQVSELAETCNRQELQARRAQEASFNLYLNHFVDRHQPYIQEGVVFNVKIDCFDLVVCPTGRTVRVYTNTFEEDWIWESKLDPGGNAMWKVFINFPETELEPEQHLVVDIFTTVQVELLKAPKLNKLKAKLCRPRTDK